LTSRAMVARARTLEVLEDLGSLLVHIPRRCKNTAALTFRRSTHQVPVHAVGAAAPHRADPRGSLTALGTKVRYGWTFTGLRQRADGFDVQVDDPDGAHRLIRALLVISADRGRSAVRGAVEIPLVGEDYEGNFLLADVEMTSDLSDEAIHNFLAPEGTMVIETLPDGKSRIVTTDVPAAVAPTCDELEVLIHVRATTTARIASIAWMSRSRVAHRIAAAYRRGRVLLAGDAAHQHSPAGGQGMSTGIQDAVVLAEIAHAALRRDDDLPGVLAVT
jgi:2-polyprenyl-6-methoxyphenol hydroxylase-like FAD-dependent oxidoreductase